MPTFTELKSEYTFLWKNMVIKPEKLAAVTAIANKLIAHKGRYLPVAAKTGAPWHVIAALHERESDADFDTYLGNGELLTRKTKLVPKGRGPFASWEAGAIDALHLDGLDQITDWSPERACFELEVFNGFGYRGKGINSPYLWSFSNNYTRGKYTETPKGSTYRPNMVDAQCGAIPVVRRIMELDSSARLTSPGLAKPTGTAIVIGAGGGVVAKQAHDFGVDIGLIVAILAVTAIAAVAAFFAVRWYRSHHPAA